MKECKSSYHEGDRLMPDEAMVKNGRFRRHVCRACWCKEIAARTAAKRDREGLSIKRWVDLNKLFKRTT